MFIINKYKWHLGVYSTTFLYYDTPYLSACEKKKKKKSHSHNSSKSILYSNDFYQWKQANIIWTPILLWNNTIEM